MLGLAFIIPAYKIFGDIKSRFGEAPLLCASTSVVQPYNVLNDGENAEQPLLDLIKGKGTGTMMLFHGLPRVDETVTHKAIKWYARRAGYSIKCSDLAKIVAKIESTTMSVGCSSVDLTRFDFSIHDLTSSTDTSISTCHKSVTYRNHRPVFDDADYSALRLSWSSVPPTSFPTSSGFLGSRDNPIPNISASSQEWMFITLALRSIQLFQFGSKPLSRSSLLNHIGKPLLECPLYRIGHPQAFVPMRITQWFRYQLIQFYAGHLTRFDSRISRTMKDAFLFSYCHVWNTIIKRYDSSDYSDFECFLRENELLSLWDILWRDERYVSEQLPSWYCRYWPHELLSLYSGAVPSYKVRQYIKVH